MSPSVLLAQVDSWYLIKAGTLAKSEHKALPSMKWWQGNKFDI
jgi:hypothetical protein